MAWSLADNRIRTDIGTISLSQTDPDGNNPNRTIVGVVEVLDQNGEVMKTWTGDMIPHLLTSEKQQLAAILDAVRLRAAAQFIG